jgi:hypothetical protein
LRSLVLAQGSPHGEFGGLIFRLSNYDIIDDVKLMLCSGHRLGGASGVRAS